jgi:hypothetical protein
MNQLWLPEAALRSLLMGATIFAALKVLRIRQVHAGAGALAGRAVSAAVFPSITGGRLSNAAHCSCRAPFSRGAPGLFASP